MSSLPYLTSSNLYGVYEMDTAGTVLYHRSLTGSQTQTTAASLTGRNFFDELAHVQNFSEFERHFKYFISDSHPTNEFKINFRFQERVLESRVKFVRVSERENNQRSSVIIVDIRQL